MEPLILLSIMPDDDMLPLSGISISAMTDAVVRYLACMSINETVQSEFDKYIRAEIGIDRLRMVLRLAGEG